MKNTKYKYVDGVLKNGTKLTKNLSNVNSYTSLVNQY